MNLFKSFGRTIKKNSAIAKATHAELTSSDFNSLMKSRTELYLFLIKDDILSDLMEDLSFEQFYDAISAMKAVGICKSAQGDYIPVSTFCFVPTLSLAIAYFVKKELDWDTFIQFVVGYFST